MTSCVAGADARSRDFLDSLDREVKQTLPLGSSREDVVAFLKKHYISVRDSREIKYYKGRPKIWGLITKTGHKEIVSTEATLTFEFSADGVLTAYKMTKQLVGP